MKKILGLFLLLLSAVLSGGCDKVPRNGWLDGQWQLVEMDETDVKAQKIYWRFQLDLLQFYSPVVRLSTDIKHNAVMSRFEHRGRQLTLPHAYLIIRSEGRDSLITPQMNIDLSAFGVDRLPLTYRVVSAESQSMVLETDQHRLVFRKF